MTGPAHTHKDAKKGARWKLRGYDHAGRIRTRAFSDYHRLIEELLISYATSQGYAAAEIWTPNGEPYEKAKIKR